MHGTTVKINLVQVFRRLKIFIKFCLT